jgi:HD superfamily phosphohydrolase
MSKRVDIKYGQMTKTFRYQSSQSLDDQLRISFRIPSLSYFEILDCSNAVTPLADLEDNSSYVLRRVTGDDWTSRPLWETKDPIYGMISLPDVCLKFIDTPEFQRLRDLKQTGSCNLVYIGAHHTRFDHSIGVGWLGFRMVFGIAERQPELGIDARDILCVTLAALCHDLGHGAGSHMWDSAILKRIGVDMPHEEMSLKIFDHIVESTRSKYRMMRISDDPFDGLTDQDFKFIKALIHAPKCEYNIDTVGRPENKLFLMDIVSNKSNGLDIDRCDYIQRDTFNCGVRGVFDVDRLIKNVVIREVEGKLCMCWPQKDLEGIIEIFHTRDSLHRRVYQHRTNVGIESMYRDAILSAVPCIQIRNDAGAWLDFKDAQLDVTSFLKISDWIFHLLVHGQDFRVDWEDPRVMKAREILTDIKYRNIYRFVGTLMGHVEDHESAKRELERCSGGYIIAEQWELKNGMFSWGHGEKNPLENVPFLKKSSDDPSKPKSDDLSRVFVPAAFKEHVLYVYVKSQDPEVRELAKTAFTQWSQERGIESSLVDMSSVALSKKSRKRPSLSIKSPPNLKVKRVSPKRNLQRAPSKACASP